MADITNTGSMDKNDFLLRAGVRRPSSVVDSSIRSLCLFSGGLDSQLAVRILQAQGIAVHGLVFTSIFFNSRMVEQAARRLGIPLLVEDFTPILLNILNGPKHGFGAGLNPCIDCHIAMIRRSGELMRQHGFQFVSTGEVVNQRPMSQRRQALLQVAAESGIGNFLLRPLSAGLLPETEPEKQGWVERSRLLALEGRNRKPQMELAREFGIADYPQPAGGCLLTDPAYGRRLRDLKDNEGLEIVGIRRLRLGRHFRFGSVRVIIGRNKSENEQLEKERSAGEYLLKPRAIPGPSALLPHDAMQDDLKRAAEICAHYSDFSGPGSVTIEMQGPAGVSVLSVRPAATEAIASWRI